MIGSEIATLVAVPDPNGDGKMPILDSQGRSIGGFLYLDDLFIEVGSDDVVDLSISPSAPFDEAPLVVVVATNNPGGYTLSIESKGANLVCADNPSLVIPSTAVNTIGFGTWGYQVGTSTTANGWAATPTTMTQIAYNDQPVDPENTQVNFAVRDGNPIPLSPRCGKYVQDVIHTAIANM